jgi:hypothetical protein
MLFLNALFGLVPSASLLFEVLEVSPHRYVRQQVFDAGNCALINMQSFYRQKCSIYNVKCAHQWPVFLIIFNYVISVFPIKLSICNFVPKFYFHNATTCPLWISWSTLPAVAEV